MKKLVSIGLLFFGLLLGSCGPYSVPEFSLQADAKKVNAEMESVALLIAQAITDTKLASRLNELLMTGYEGDTEVLWSTLLEADFAGKPLIEPLSSLYAKQTGETEAIAKAKLLSLVKEIPLLQVALRAAPEGWDPAKGSLVAVSPDGIAEDELKELSAFDAQGKEYKLDAHKAPAEPIIVIGLNESGSQESQPQDEIGLNTQFLPGHVHDKCRVVTVKDIFLINDHEPWHKGKPELWLQVNGSASPAINLFKARFRDIEEGKRKTYNRHIVDWCPPTEGDFLAFMWYEEDSGAEITISPFLKGKVALDSSGSAVEAGVNFSFKLKDGDDLVGEQTIGKISGNLSGTTALVNRAPGDIDWNTLLTFDASDVVPPPPPPPADADGDGIDTTEEQSLKQSDPARYGCLNPNDADSDNDGLSDGDEVFIWQTSPCSPDTDRDGLNDLVETQHSCLNPTVADAHLDYDGDGISNQDEITQRLNPCRSDTDGDGFDDGIDLCPNRYSQTNTDMDGDGIGDACDFDADGDGCTRMFDPDDFDPNVFCTVLSTNLAEGVLAEMPDDRLGDPRLKLLIEGETWPLCDKCLPNISVLMNDELHFSIDPKSYGYSENDAFASATSVLGDLNKDGIGELAIGAATAQGEKGLAAAGQILILSGKDGTELARLEGGSENMMLGKAFYSGPDSKGRY